MAWFLNALRGWNGGCAIERYGTPLKFHGNRYDPSYRLFGNQLQRRFGSGDDRWLGSSHRSLCDEKGNQFW
ncbi:MAG: hypothetical protein AAGA77_17400 [Bacteroidota bacterium]